MATRNIHKAHGRRAAPKPDCVPATVLQRRGLIHIWSIWDVKPAAALSNHMSDPKEIPGNAFASTIVPPREKEL